MKDKTLIPRTFYSLEEYYGKIAEKIRDLYFNPKVVQNYTIPIEKYKEVLADKMRKGIKIEVI